MSSLQWVSLVLLNVGVAALNQTTIRRLIMATRKELLAAIAGHQRTEGPPAAKATVEKVQAAKAARPVPIRL